jgi:hypothetical protein
LEFIMALIFNPNQTAFDRERQPWLMSSGGLAILEPLSRSVRADVSVAVAPGARSFEEMVVMKRFHRDAPGADWIHLVIELELARKLRHDNLVRTLGIGLEAGGYFQITEFLEGMALPQLLAWARSAKTRFSNAVVARILLAIIDVVKHAQSVATSESALELIRGPVAAEDVFITYDGQVKVLGFKSAHARGDSSRSVPRAVAIDVLLQQHMTPELRGALRALSQHPDPQVDHWHEIREALYFWRDEESASDGRNELRRLLRNVLQHERARSALRLASAFAQLRAPQLRAAARAAADDAPPQSGVRKIGALDLEPERVPLGRTAGSR